MAKTRKPTNTDDLNKFRRDAALAILAAYLRSRVYYGELNEDMELVDHAIRMADEFVSSITKAPAASAIRKRRAVA